MDIVKVLEGAESYVPIAKKVDFVNHCAQRCFDRLGITAEDGAKPISSLPPMWKENVELKSRYIMGGLLKLYLKQNPQTEDGDEWLVSRETYDEWGKLHILNLIERTKSNAALRDKCFDLLQDYKALEKMLNTEVYGMLAVMNDSVSRAIAQIESSITPESLKQTTAALEESKREYEKYMAESGRTPKQE